MVVIDQLLVAVNGEPMENRFTTPIVPPRGTILELLIIIQMISVDTTQSAAANHVEVGIARLGMGNSAKILIVIMERSIKRIFSRVQTLLVTTSL